jgi:hypothetical protein
MITMPNVEDDEENPDQNNYMNVIKQSQERG